MISAGSARGGNGAKDDSRLPFMVGGAAMCNHGYIRLFVANLEIDHSYISIL